MKILRKIAGLTAGFDQSFGMMKANLAQAVNLTYDFTVQLSNSPNTYSGFFSFDPSVGTQVTDFRFDFTDAFGVNKTYTLSDLTSSTAVISTPTGAPQSKLGGFRLLEFQSKPIFVSGGFNEFFWGVLSDSGLNFFGLVGIRAGVGERPLVRGEFVSVEARFMPANSVPEPDNSSVTEALAILSLGGVSIKKKLASKKQQLKLALLEFTK